MTNLDGLRVVMFVLNDCTRDARVLKEAGTLARNGARVTVVARASKNTPMNEERDGFTIVRIHTRQRSTSPRKPYRTKIDPVDRLKRTFPFLGHSVPRHNGTSSNVAPPPGMVALGGMALLLYYFRAALLPLGLLTRLLTRLLLGGFRFTSRIVWAVARKVNHGFGPVELLYHYPAIYRRARSIPADVYHAHDLNTLPVVWLLAHNKRRKLVFDSHELYTEATGITRAEGVVFGWMERHLIRRVDQVITVNVSIAHELSSRYSVPVPTVVRNCPPAYRGSSESPLRRGVIADPSDRIILYHGGYAPHRGLEELIESMKDVSGAVLVMMGWGGLEGRLRELSSTTELRGRVYFLPPVSQSDLLSWTMGADLGVIPYKPISLNNNYTSPNKLFEFIQAGIPIVGSDLPELRRVIVDEDIGRVFKPGDPDSMAGVIRDMLSDPQAYGRYKENVKRIAPNYCWERESEKLLGVYRGFASKGRNGIRVAEDLNLVADRT